MNKNGAGHLPQVVSIKKGVMYESGGVCAILLRLYTSTERLKRVYTSPGPLLEKDYFTLVMVLIIIYNFYVYSFYLKLTKIFNNSLLT
jgi:hypothetical protein